MRTTRILIASALLAAACSNGSTDSSVEPTTPTDQSTTTVSVAEMSERDLANTFGPAVFRVEATGCDSSSFGTAFAVDSEYLVTNRHVVAIDPTPQVVSRDGTRYQAKVIGWSADPDLAVLRISGEAAVALAWEPTSSLSEGDRLVVLGYPMPDHQFTVSEGSIQSFVSAGNETKAIAIDAAVDYGNSGSPALTSIGSVAGMLSAVDPNPEGLRIIPLVLPTDQIRGVADHLMAEPIEQEPDCEGIEGTAQSDLMDEVVASLAECPACQAIVIPTLEGETPPMPEVIPGWRTDGSLYSQEVRVFPGQFSAPMYFPWADHGCTALWTARWRTVSGDVVGTVREPYFTRPGEEFGEFWPDSVWFPATWAEFMGDTPMPPGSTSGFLAGSICELPTWTGIPGNENRIVDLVVDWLYWTVAP